MTNKITNQNIYPLVDASFSRCGLIINMVPEIIRVTVIDGPNIDQTHLRPKSQYSLYRSINDAQEVDYFYDPEEVITDWNKALGNPFAITYSQFNSEGAIISALNNAYEIADCIILNAAAYTHTSVAIHDCLEYRTIPVIEVHMSNPYEREDFRKTNLISSVSDLHIMGYGECAYISALYAVRSVIQHHNIMKSKRMK